MPGIIIQTVLFGTGQTGVGLADDLSKGIVDRYRSLPMARSSFSSRRGEFLTSNRFSRFQNAIAYSVAMTFSSIDVQTIQLIYSTPSMLRCAT